MGYTGLKPADTQSIAQGPADIRDEIQGLATGQIVNAGMLKGYSPGNAAGNIPVSNGTVCTGLNADKLDGNAASAFATAGHTHAAATASKNGLMSNTDKIRLDGIAAGAEVNQNAFGNILIGGTTIAADTATDTFELIAGPNIGLTPNATNDSVIIGVTGTVPTAGTCTGNAATATNATNHIAAATGAHQASAIACAATGDVAAMNVQAAIAELASGKVATSDVVTTATENKILKLNASGVLPASITGSSTSCTGNAATANNLTTPTTGYMHVGAWGVGRVDTGAILVNTAYRADLAAQLLNGAGAGFTADQIWTWANGLWNGGTSFGQNGWQRFGNGLILQWGKVNYNGDGLMTFAFPIVFPTTCMLFAPCGLTMDDFHWDRWNFYVDRANSIDDARNLAFIAFGY
jgi:hypothetical protein